MTRDSEVNAIVAAHVGGRPVTGVVRWSANPGGGAVARQYDSAAEAVRDGGGGTLEVFTADGSAAHLPGVVVEELYEVYRQSVLAARRLAPSTVKMEANFVVWLRPPDGAWSAYWAPFATEADALHYVDVYFGLLAPDRVQVLPTGVQP